MNWQSMTAAELRAGMTVKVIVDEDEPPVVYCLGERLNSTGGREFFVLQGSDEVLALKSKLTYLAKEG
jgi:hypothetical protein